MLLSKHDWVTHSGVVLHISSKQISLGQHMSSFNVICVWRHTHSYRQYRRGHSISGDERLRRLRPADSAVVRLQLLHVRRHLSVSASSRVLHVPWRSHPRYRQGSLSTCAAAWHVRANEDQHQTKAAAATRTPVAKNPKQELARTTIGLYTDILYF